MNRQGVIVFDAIALYVTAIFIRIMKNCLVISDLSYLQDINDSAITGGYVSANGFTSTQTDLWSAEAVAGAFAVGDRTYTKTKTNAVTKNFGSVNYSSANATAMSYAYSDNQTASYWSSDSSTSIELNYGNE